VPLNTGQVLRDRYRIDALLGQGGMGAVYRAWDLNLNIRTVVKENLLASGEAQRQFVREAGLLASLRHANLPRVTDYFSLPARGQYLVMDYIEGEDLKQMVGRLGPLAQDQALAWIGQVLNALAFLHSQHVIHRDVKPANVKITPQGQVFLVDFGLAKVYDPGEKTTMGARAVTPGFAPLEQYGQGRTDARTDLYSVGATLYALLTARTPPDGPDLATGGARLVPPRRLNPRVSRDVEAAVLKAMQTRPVDRFQTAAEFRSALLRPPSTRNRAAKRRLIPPRARPQRQTLPETESIQTAGPRLADREAATRRAPERMPVGKVPVREPWRSAWQEAQEMARKRMEAWAVGVRSTLAAAKQRVTDALAGRRAHQRWQSLRGPLAIVLVVVAVLVVVLVALRSSTPVMDDAVLFTSDRDGGREVYRLNRGETVRLTHTPGDGESWSPASGPGGSVLFTSDRDGRREVYRLNQGETVRLTYTPGGGQSWSPASGPGGSVLFTSDRDGKWEVYRLSQGETVRLTQTPGGGQSWSPAVGPGGSVLFTSDRDGKREVYRLSQGETVRLTRTSGERESWSPSLGPGGSVLFTSDRDGKREAYRLSQGETLRLTYTAGGGQSWSPDLGPGDSVLFTSDRDAQREVYRLYQGETVRLTHTPGDGQSWWGDLQIDE
jgi:hypothetical protein